MLLPMLSIYNEYVRNHHFSLQVLAECKQHSAFNLILKQYEAKPVCEGRSLETFLTYPMHQVTILFYILLGSIMMGLIFFDVLNRDRKYECLSYEQDGNSIHFL